MEKMEKAYQCLNLTKKLTDVSLPGFAKIVSNITVLEMK